MFNQDFILATAQLDRFMGSLFITPGSNTFKRFNFYYINGDTHILRTYPAEKIQNPNLALNKSNTPYGKIFFDHNK